jgi:hypothetical protein
VGVCYLALMKNYTSSIHRIGFMALALGTLWFCSGCATASKPAKAGKLYHVGLVWLKEPGKMQFLSVGQTLPSTSPYVDDSFDVCVVMQFADKTAMERYNQHPVHQKAAQEAFLPLSQKIRFYDFTSE